MAGRISHIPILGMGSGAHFFDGVRGYLDVTVTIVYAEYEKYQATSLRRQIMKIARSSG